MNVDVDEARSHGQACRIDDVRRVGSVNAIESREPAIRDAHIEALGWGAGAIDDDATLDQDVEVHLRIQFFASRLGQQLARHPPIAREQTAVHPKHRARDPGCVVRGEEECGIRDVVRLPDPA